MHMGIDCIIVEDEPLAQDRLRGFLEKLPFIRLLGVFDNGLDALTFLQTGSADLIFLDINIGDFSGIQLLESMKISSQVIISTAYHEFALKGFELNVTDYLLKPYTFERFVQAVDKARQNLGKAGGNANRKFIFIRTEYRLEKLLLEDLLYIEGMRDYRRIYATDRQIMTLQTFRELEEAIPDGVACRVHKSFMVALDKIDIVEKDTIRIRQALIPISDTYRKAFLRAIG
jgi:two-component system, LytTR family, response regulator